MNRDELIEAFEMGDMGDVEFMERALETDMSIEDIGAVMSRVREEDEFGG